MLDQTTNLKDLLDDPSLLETRAYVNGAWVAAKDGKRFVAMKKDRHVSTTI